MGNKMVEVPTDAIVHHHHHHNEVPANNFNDFQHEYNNPQEEQEQQRSAHQYSNGHANFHANLLSNGHTNTLMGTPYTDYTTEKEPETLPLNNNNSNNVNNNASIPNPKAARKRRRMRLCLLISILILVILIGIGIGSAYVLRNPRILQFPLHASCNVTWTFSSSCNNVRQNLMDQIETWKTNETCGLGQKCLYSFESIAGDVLKATHTTPVRKYIDDMHFTFYSANRKSGKGCQVVGFSTSRIWYAVLDYGTNYCNLHNLVEGAGLTKDKIYSEITRDEICTQYSTANCEKY